MGGSSRINGQTETALRFITCASVAEFKEEGVRQQVRAHTTRRQHQQRRSEEPFREVAGPTGKVIKLKDTTTHVIDVTAGATLSCLTSLLAKDSTGIFSDCLHKAQLDHQTMARLCDRMLQTNAERIRDSNKRDRAESSEATLQQLQQLLQSDALPFAVLVLQTVAGFKTKLAPDTTTDFDTTVLRLRGFILSMISQRVTSKEKGSTGDAFVCAVALMVVFEATQGSKEHCAVHMRSLHQLVEMRGGFSRMDGILARLVAWAVSSTAELRETA